MENPIIEIDGRYFQAEKPALKTIHKDGEVVIGGFREVEKWSGVHGNVFAPVGEFTRIYDDLKAFDECWKNGAYDGQECDLCPYCGECSAREDKE